MNGCSHTLATLLLLGSFACFLYAAVCLWKESRR